MKANRKRIADLVITTAGARQAFFGGATTFDGDAVVDFSD